MSLIWSADFELFVSRGQ